MTVVHGCSGCATSGGVMACPHHNPLRPPEVKTFDFRALDAALAAIVAFYNQVIKDKDAELEALRAEIREVIEVYGRAAISEEERS